MKFINKLPADIQLKIIEYIEVDNKKVVLDELKSKFYTCNFCKCPLAIDWRVEHWENMEWSYSKFFQYELEDEYTCEFIFENGAFNGKELFCCSNCSDFLDSDSDSDSD
tara:strand:- start:1140 stop:1466 length:327 start_codon:yes stop_codon:yes gene_type:complete